MNYAAALAAVRAGAPDVGALDALARAAIEEGEEEAALQWLRPAAERSRLALLWQWVGLLHRSLDDHAAVDAFAQAAQRAPDDAGIAHGHARVALEAGLSAVPLFLRARALAPSDGAVLLGLAAARFAQGQGREAADELSHVLERAPGWVDGYDALAQLRSTLGERQRASEMLERAIARFPNQEELWTALFRIRLRTEDYRALEDDVGRAEAAGVSRQSLTFYRGVIEAELAAETFPPTLFGAAAGAERLAIWRVRHLLRVGAIAEAVAAVDAALSAGSGDAWPYAALAWRLAEDERSSWLEDQGRLVRTFDLDDLPPLAQLAETLRQLHVANGEYLDQSVRGGTQTDGPLLSRIDPIIRDLRRAIVSAVEGYVSELPPPDPRHPLLAKRRDRRIRFSGSWSVRLRGGGRHANHVHPQGWISSALYVAVPRRSPAEPPDAGWFKVGEPPEDLGLAVPGVRTVEPVPGRLVLFPSWMWHGTVPFEEGERLTIAFDVRPPI